jgi:hypothetical protein
MRYVVHFSKGLERSSSNVQHAALSPRLGSHHKGGTVEADRG